MLRVRTKHRRSPGGVSPSSLGSLRRQTLAAAACPPPPRASAPAGRVSRRPAAASSPASAQQCDSRGGGNATTHGAAVAPSPAGDDASNQGPADDRRQSVSKGTPGEKAQNVMAGRLCWSPSRCRRSRAPRGSGTCLEQHPSREDVRRTNTTHLTEQQRFGGRVTCTRTGRWSQARGVRRARRSSRGRARSARAAPSAARRDRAGQAAGAA